MNELKLLRSIYNAQRNSVSPKLFHGTNLLLTPLHDLTAACRELAEGNMFISFAPPRNFAARIDAERDFYENLPDLPSLDSALHPQICSCPGYASVCSCAPASFWSSLLGPDGFLNCTYDQIAEFSGLTPAEARRFIENLQDFVEPPGLFASGLAESLAIQLRRAGMEGSAAWTLLTEGREALLSGKIAEWGERRGFSVEQIEAAMRALRRLDPAPGRNFARAQYATPDVEFVIKGGVVSPRLIVDNMPVVESHLGEFGLAEGEIPSEPWMRREWNAARRVLKLLGLRSRTVMRCALYISSIQREKILDMSLPPKPMTYTGASAELSLHASTLHRCARNTYCEINGRSYPLAVFFSRASASNKKLSVAELRVRVAELRSEGMTNGAIGRLLGVPERTIAYHSAKMATLRKRG